MLHRTLLASACAIALSGAALAADLPAQAPPPVYIPPPPPTWTGLYVGINAGYTWSDRNAVDTFTANVFGNPALAGGFQGSVVSAALATQRPTARIDGFIGGGQFGYNYQFGSWVAGLELDFQGLATSSGRSTLFSASGVPGFAGVTLNQLMSVRRDSDWLGTVRGRIGFTLWPTVLIYGTGGLAYGQAAAATVILQQYGGAPGVPGAFGSFGGFNVNSATALAGWTAGGGIEWMVWPNWSIKAEYLYYDLGRVTYALTPLTSFNAAGVPFTGGAPFSRTTFNGSIARAGINYHFNWGVPAPIVSKY